MHQGLALSATISPAASNTLTTCGVAPYEIPHSHPVLTLNARLYNPEEILCEYLHEQMHWYAERLGCAEEGSPLIAELKRRYPDAPVGFPEGGNDEFSSYLHLLVNWLKSRPPLGNSWRANAAEEIARNTGIIIGGCDRAPCAGGLAEP